MHSNPVQKTTAAGTKRNVKEKYLRHRHYLKTLTSLQKHYVTQNNIVAKKHAIYTVNQTKISLSAVDSKRYILNDGINTLAHGHWRIAAEKTMEYPFNLHGC